MAAVDGLMRSILFCHSLWLVTSFPWPFVVFVSSFLGVGPLVLDTLRRRVFRCFLVLLLS